MIGIERQTRGKPVGIRTAILIISGTYLFMSMAVSLSPNTLDQARVLGQIITGVGFLGAGVMMTLDGKIHGVLYFTYMPQTTACSLGSSFNSRRTTCHSHILMNG